MIVAMRTTRRDWIRKGAVLGAAGGALLPAQTAGKKGDDPDIRLAVATYSLREFRRDLAIRMIQELKVQWVDVKEYHLPYNDTPAQLAAGRKAFENAGLKIAAGGNIAMHNDDEADIRRYFDYARNCGMPVMVIAPTHQNLAKIEKLAGEYNVKIAIHNHGPEDPHFPTPQSVLKAVKDMDPRMGSCLDAGHTIRTGADVVESIREAGPRLHEIHIKDVRSTANDAQCPVGQGIMPIPAIFRELKAQRYPGTVSLEYEAEPDNPMPGMQQSFAFMRGVLAGMRG